MMSETVSNQIKNIDISEEKNIKNTYLYIKNLNINTESYESKLLLEENIEDVLKFQIGYENEKRVLIYDVSGTISLEEYLKSNKLTEVDVCNIVTSIDNVLTSAENYLLSENSIALDLRLIRIKKNDTGDLKLCFVLIPNYNLDFSYELSKFLIRVLRFIDVKDKDALNLAYGLFVRSSKEDYVMSDLMELIDKVKIRNSKNEYYDEDVFRAYDESLANEIDEDIMNENKYNMMAIDEDEIVESEDYEKENVNNKNVFEGKKDIEIDLDTKDFLANELYEDFDKEDKKIIKFGKKNKKKFLNAHIKIDFLCYVITPFAIIAIPIFYYFINGKEKFLGNAITIFTVEFILFILLAIGRIINYRMEKV